MKVAQFTPGADTGGQSIAIHKAFQRLSLDVEVRSLVASNNYLDYPRDFPKWTTKEAMALYDWADVVHFHNNMDFYGKWDLGRRKPLVVHHHGSRFRDSAKMLYEQGKAAGATQFVSTVDLLTLLPDADLDWLPQVVDVERMQRIRAEEYKGDGWIHIAHAPTDRSIKGTDGVERVVRGMGRRRKIVLDVIEGVSHEECLRRKARADIFIDQFELGYGNNTTEAWAMGIPVIAGATSVIKAKMRRVYGHRILPFVEATHDSLPKVIETLIKSATVRKGAIKRGTAHVMEFHSEEAVVGRLTGLYLSLKPSAGGPQIEELLGHYRDLKEQNRYIPKALKEAVAAWIT